MDLEPVPAQVQQTQIRNPEQRPFWHWLATDNPAVEKMGLGASLRYGQNISDFLRAWLPHCRNLHSHRSAPYTQLWHILYDGSAWETMEAAMLRKQGRWQSATQGGKGMGKMATRPVAWHENLYHAMAVQIYYDVEWAKEQGDALRPRARLPHPHGRPVEGVPAAALQGGGRSGHGGHLARPHGANRALPEASENSRCGELGSAPGAPR